MTFDENGMLILPSGTVEEFSTQRKPRQHYVHTGVFVTCDKCGHTWERQTLRKATVRCFVCREKIPVDRNGRRVEA